MKQEWRIFLTALSFYTRIPVKIQNNYLNSSIRYLPLIGCLTGAVSSLIFIYAGLIFNLNLAVAFSILVSIIITGALHEDGLADACDGFGGGWTTERILQIMKDSRIGTFGVTGLISILAFKFLALQQLFSISPIKEHLSLIVIFFILAQSLSRFSSITMIFTHRYVSADNNKSGPMVLDTKSFNFYIALFFTLIPITLLVIITQQYKWILILVPVALVNQICTRFFNKWIGGYTGDCLGAIQQVSEVIIYLSFIVLWKFF